MPFSILIESYREFAERHGNRPLNVAGRLAFFDGATSSTDGESRMEPPTHPVENLRCRLQYWRTAVARASEDFYSLRGQCQQAAELASRYSNLPGPSNLMLADLHKLQAAVAYCRAEVAKLEAELAAKAANHPDHQRLQFRQQQERSQQAAAAAVLGEISSINI